MESSPLTLERLCIGHLSLALSCMGVSPGLFSRNRREGSHIPSEEPEAQIWVSSGQVPLD